MDPEIICGISSQAEDSTFDKTNIEWNSRNQLRKLDLKWSGNSAVLRAWSEPQGLPSIPLLETVNINVSEDTVVSQLAPHPLSPLRHCVCLCVCLCVFDTYRLKKKSSLLPIALDKYM